MKRLLRIIILLVITAGLAACSVPGAGQSQTPVPTVPFSPMAEQSHYPSRTFTLSPSPTSLPTPLPSIASPTPEPAPTFIPDTDIPDIFKSTNKPVPNSNYTLYENKKYIYYLNQNDSTDRYLFLIDKKTRRVKQITKKDCSCFTVNKGIVYYTELSEPNEGYWNVIKSYNPSTNKKKTVRKFNYSVASMAAYNNKMYFSYFPKNSEASVSNLYVMNFDGTGKKKIKEDVYTFCIYKNVIYYSESSCPDSPPIDKVNLDGSGWKEFIEYADWDFYISDNKLFHQSGYIDLKSGEFRGLLYNNFALFGKYLIYNDYTGAGNKETCSFYIYDLEGVKTKSLAQIEDIDADSSYMLHSTKDNIYYSVASHDGSFELYRLVIKQGKASMEPFASYKTSTKVAPAPTDTAGPEPEPTGSPEPTSDAY